MSERGRAHPGGMRFRPGTRLGSYEVLSFIGGGVQGEVYRARDARLGREVAVKTLHAFMSGDAERLRRFEQEARAAGALNHPNILAIHDIGQEGGVPYLVSELLVGETLRQRLAGGAIPASKAVGYAIQVARGMAAAHERGIFHRDLKPENLFLTNDGVVKILDFGLAKLSRPKEPAGEGSAALTEGRPTEPGTVLGTVGYMSPEQVRGLGIDQRSDIFSFGAIVYEMLTGRQAFGRESAVETMNAILKEEPPEMATSGSGVSTALQRIVGHCLEKRPEERFQSARDVVFALESLSGAPALQEALHPAGAPEVAVAGTGEARRLAHWVPLLALSVLFLGLFGWLLSRLTSDQQPVVRLALPAPEATGTVAISPDGKRLVYRAGAYRLVVRAMEENEGRPIQGTEGSGGLVFFSPDGKWVGFAAEGKLKKVSLTGGAPVTLCDAGQPMGATWGSDGRIVFARSVYSGLLEVPASGGKPREITSPDRSRGERSHRYPHFLPDGKALLFTVGSPRLTSWDDARIDVLNLGTGERRVLIEGGHAAVYSPTGHIVYARSGSLLAVPFDDRRLTVTGAPMEVVQGVRTSPVWGGQDFALSATGTLIYAPGGPLAPRSRLVRVDREGMARPIFSADVAMFAPRISPDGRSLALSLAQANNQIGRLDLERGSLTQLTFEWTNQLSMWTPDGRWIIGSSDEWGWNLFRVPADGSGARERLTIAERAQSPGSVSPDGKLLLFDQMVEPGRSDIWLLPLDGHKEPFPFIQGPGSKEASSFSPDGRLVAYQSDESGRGEVYVRSFPEGGRRLQVSTDGGFDPVWARNGRELFYRAKGVQRPFRMMVVEVLPGEPPRLSKPRMLFEDSYAFAGNSLDYDVMPDGKSFVMVEIEREPLLINHFNVVLNWFEELKRRVPAQ